MFDGTRDPLYGPSWMFNDGLNFLMWSASWESTSNFVQVRIIEKLSAMFVAEAQVLHLRM